MSVFCGYLPVLCAACWLVSKKESSLLTYSQRLAILLPYYDCAVLSCVSPPNAQHLKDEIVDSKHSGPHSTFTAYSVTGPAVYHFGIVDFLQNWTISKRMERLFKIYVERKDPDGLSVMPPAQYKLRFQSKMSQIFDIDFASPNSISFRDILPTLQNGALASEERLLEQALLDTERVQSSKQSMITSEDSPQLAEKCNEPHDLDQPLLH